MMGPNSEGPKTNKNAKPLLLWSRAGVKIFWGYIEPSLGKAWVQTGGEIFLYNVIPTAVGIISRLRQTYGSERVSNLFLKLYYTVARRSIGFLELIQHMGKPFPVAQS